MAIGSGVCGQNVARATLVFTGRSPVLVLLGRTPPDVPRRPRHGPSTCVSMGGTHLMPGPTRVQLLVTCLVDRLFPETGMAVVRVLERLALVVEYPEAQTCCGQPAANAG